ncbi:MAG TPA: choice-of-anchor tandem repeat GloVer-containing protein [Rhizomicrobium sp.]|nr:choice-of-anchor tandem repeat GloVer-containing protein [Rhizomicrobium sp.]
MKRIFIALIAGLVCCAFVQPASAMDATKANENVLYSFCYGTNCGTTPTSSLLDLGGVLYGTTSGGGREGGGTVFALDTKNGVEMILYSFDTGGTDGNYPFAGLIDVDGILYGTTLNGGNTNNACQLGCGTVYSVDPGTGAETVVYSFCSQQGCADGAIPIAGLIDAKGTLYGTTSQGGVADCYCGTVFSLDPKAGTEKLLYSFCSQQNCRDGANPEEGKLINVRGTLYGTTTTGGANCPQYPGCGIVFALDPTTGTETVLYSFCSRRNCRDGAFPRAGVIDVNGTLYGTTASGGDNNNADCPAAPGCGTVYSLDPATGAEKVLYSFCGQQNCTDGQSPAADLIAVNGTIYGTTSVGGASCPTGIGCGLVFRLDPATGAERTVYSFCGQPACTDGAGPAAGLISVKGALYGTTGGGGTYGAGTVFGIKNP